MLNPDNATLEWCAKWIEDSLAGETNERTVEFGKNMAMTIRAVKTDGRATAPLVDVRSLFERLRVAIKEQDVGPTHNALYYAGFDAMKSMAFAAINEVERQIAQPATPSGPQTCVKCGHEDWRNSEGLCGALEQDGCNEGDVSRCGCKCEFPAAGTSAIGDVISRRYAANLLCGFCEQGIFPLHWIDEAGTYKHHTPSSETPWVTCRASRIHALPAIQVSSTSAIEAAKEIVEYVNGHIGLNEPKYGVEGERRIAEIITRHINHAHPQSVEDVGHPRINGWPCVCPDCVARRAASSSTKGDK